MAITLRTMHLQVKRVKSSNWKLAARQIRERDRDKRSTQRSKVVARRVYCQSEHEYTAAMQGEGLPVDQEQKERAKAEQE